MEKESICLLTIRFNLFLGNELLEIVYFITCIFDSFRKKFEFLSEGIKISSERGAFCARIRNSKKNSY
ncbi:hypothetical protein DW095_05700 [Bacteroides sp. AM07-16]|nr:hypothetical protein DW095_05700 [Bacteroides sp. AM07-16]